MKNQEKNLVSSFGSGNQNQEEYPERNQGEEEGSKRKQREKSKQKWKRGRKKTRKVATLVRASVIKSGQRRSCPEKSEHFQSTPHRLDRKGQRSQVNMHWKFKDTYSLGE